MKTVYQTSLTFCSLARFKKKIIVKITFYFVHWYIFAYFLMYDTLEVLLRRFFIKTVLKKSKPLEKQLLNIPLLLDTVIIYWEHGFSRVLGLILLYLQINLQLICNWLIFLPRKCISFSLCVFLLNSIFIYIIGSI